MKNTQQNAIIGAVVAVIVIIGLAVYFTEQESKNTPVVAENSTFKDDFMSGCTEAGPGFYGYCSCAYDKLEKQLGISGLIKMSIEYDETGVLPNEVLPAMTACADKLQ